MGPACNEEGKGGGDVGGDTVLGGKSHEPENEMGKESIGGGPRLMAVEYHGLAGQYVAKNFQKVFAAVTARTMASVGKRLDQAGQAT